MRKASLGSLKLSPTHIPTLKRSVRRSLVATESERAVVDVKPEPRLHQSATLVAVGAREEFSDFVAVRIPHLLAVSPTNPQWKFLLNITH